MIQVEPARSLPLSPAQLRAAKQGVIKDCVAFGALCFIGTFLLILSARAAIDPKRLNSKWEVPHALKFKNK